MTFVRDYHVRLNEYIPGAGLLEVVRRDGQVGTVCIDSLFTAGML